MVQALEAVMVALIVLGAAYSVVTLRAVSQTHDKPRANLEKLAADSLTVLNGLVDANGTMLDQALTEQYHCSRDVSPSTTTCATGRADNITEKLQFYLPPGAAYAIAIDNGIQAREIYRASTPAGEAVGASYAFVPAWNFTFVASELSCYDPGMPLNATLLPIAHARSVNASRVVLTLGATGVNVTANATGSGRWNATFAAAARPASGTLVANATAARNAGTFPGLATYGSCALGATGNATVTALRQDSLTLPASAPIGQAATLRANLTHLAAVSGATLLSSNLTVYEPIPDRPGEADTWIPATTIALGSGSTPSATWTPPDDALFGAHPVVLRALMQAGGVTYEARLVGILPVALPSGVVPLDPPYRAVLQAWFGDWR